MNLDSLPLVSHELAQSLALPAATGAAGSGITWLLIAVAMALVLGLVGFAIWRAGQPKGPAAPAASSR